MVSMRLTRSRLWALLVVFVTVGFVATFGTAVAHPFLNSAEPGCDGSDPNVLMCDDFEDGVWYSQNCDNQGHPTSSNPEPGNGDGWCGNIFADPITPANAAVCGSAGAVGTNCAATSGPRDGGVGGKNMADHAFVNFQGVDELYVRYYYKPSTGYIWSNQKALTFNDGLPGDGGIRWGNFAFNCAQALRSTIGNLIQGFPPPEDVCQSQNQGNNIDIIGNNHWYFIEMHMKLSTPVQQPNGLYELWVNDCGTTGVCTGSPILRMRRTNVRHDRTSVSQLIRVLWWENWGNSNDSPPGSQGTEYYDQIKVSKVGPIGFMGTSSAPPATPIGLSVTP